MKTSFKIGLSILLGALIGGFLVHELNILHWTIGTILGATISCLSYSPGKVIAGAKYAYKAAISWRPDTLWWKERMLFIFSFYIAGLSIMSYIVISSCFAMTGNLEILQEIQWSFSFSHANSTEVIIAKIVTTSMLLVVMPGIIAFIIWVTTLDAWQTKAGTTKQVLAWLNFISLPFTVMYFVVKFLKWVVPKVPKFLFRLGVLTVCAVIYLVLFFEMLVNFTKIFVKFIHSEARLICLVDGGIGMLIGHFFFATSLATLTGAIIGVVLGIANYYIVSIKLLKLQVKT